MWVKPDFLIPGAPRSMTTALFYYLDEHPDVCFSRVKEVNFFTRYYDKGEEWYLRFFKSWNGESRIGEASTRYMSEPQAAERIYKFNPDFKHIFVLRNPADRAYSEYKRDVEIRGVEKPFDTLVLASDQYTWPGKYYTHIRRFLSYFSKDQMLFVLFEDLASETPSETRRICQFLGVDPSFEFTLFGKVINAPRMPNSLRLQQWIFKHLRHSYDDPTTTRYVKNVARRILNSLNHRIPKGFPPMADSTRKYLIDLFEEEISSLEVLIGTDLTSWR